MQKRVKWAVIALVLIIAALPMFLLFWLMDGDDFAAVDRGQSYGSSIYKNYQGGVYAAVPSNGYYRMGEADPASFAAFDTGAFDGRQAARDQRHVYCGNQVLPDMKPVPARYLGNSYFSDGAVTYFCSMHSVRNEELGMLDEFWQKVLYQADAGPKPQTYLYPFVALPASARPYRPLLDRELATDDVRVYYRGREMPQAEPASLRRLPAGRDGDVRPSDDFFADGRRVYFHEQLLPLSDDPALYAFMVGDLYRQPYLRDPRDGMVYVGAQPFDAAHAPYRLLNEQGRHVYHALFATKDGIYFYNTQTRQVERAGDDPFASGAYIELSPYVYTDGRQALFLRAQEAWARNSRGSGGGLVSRSTLINRLEAAPDGEWKKLGAVYHGFGTVWQKGDTLYYLDELGPTQLVSNPIYQILDRSTADFLLRSQETRQITAADIRKLIRAGKLAVPQHETVLEAKTRYRKVFSIF
ncbi:DKNYY domain-containing protein [Achromobacter sp. SD115]|uniref:DKNYY domain-containing protein n=1 Tax=Achromobacter sp. SD115 TaxID=2782011 RepID=UPI001A975F2F|nr:DKNYY domain-containing protein [Achromobacter sp. SD115]MBO1015750.1 DKNYY domain-containing protein [Achromobacter sp. SD115]